jgi:hypothetical protein
MRRALSKVVLAAVVAAGIGASCEDPTGPVHDLEEAERRWVAAGPERYAYTFRETCFCGPGDRRIEVAAGEVVSVEPAENVDPGQTLEGYTVEGLFALIRESLDRDPDDVTLEFDPAAGYPTRVFFDYDHRAVDEEWGFRVQDFEALPR